MAFDNVKSGARISEFRRPINFVSSGFAGQGTSQTPFPGKKSPVYISSTTTTTMTATCLILESTSACAV